MHHNNAIFYCYFLAILFTPFDFFMFQERNFLGTVSTVSKFFQLLTYIVIIISFFFSFKEIKIQSFLNLLKLHKVFLLFFATSLLSTAFGFFNDSYNLKIQDNLYNNSIDNLSYLKNYVRPIIEILVEVHKYLFFVVLAPFILSNEHRVRFVFKILFIALLFNLFIAYIDYLLTFYHYEIIPRHLIDWRHVGHRLHGLLGEPRDAYVGLVFSLCFIFIYDEYLNRNKSSYLWALLFVPALLFTNSTSGLIGSLLFTTFILIYAIIRPKKVFFNSQIRIWLLIALVLVILYFLFSTRFQFYFIQLLKFIINLLENSTIYNDDHFITSYLINFQTLLENFFQMSKHIDQEIRYHDDRIISNMIPTGHTKSGWGLQTHQVNLLPIIKITSRFENLEIWQIIFGSGSNSISFYNNELLKINELSNSHSKFVNLLFNYGFLGVFLLIYSLFYILNSTIFETCSVSKETQIGIFLVILFSNFIHDGYFWYLIVGLIIASNTIDKKNKVNL